MNWKKLFANHILARGYDYYCEDAVLNFGIEDNIIRADVIGTEDYEVEISLNNGEVEEMYCSCPYASDGKNCKHMAAVLYEWSENHISNEEEADSAENIDLYSPISTIDEYEKKLAVVKRIVAEAHEDEVRSFLVSVLMEDEKLLFRFCNSSNKNVTKEDVNNYIRQIDIITNRYLGHDHFINYYEADDFTFELENIIDEDVRCMIDNGNYLSAFEVLNYIFVLIGNVDIDDSGGHIGVLADSIFQLWVELLSKASSEDKKIMYDRYISNILDGSVIDYLEDYIVQIVMEEFKEKEYDDKKLKFVEDMIDRSEKIDDDWSRKYSVGKWAIRYFEMLKERNTPEKQIEKLCKKYWSNPSVRRYYIDICIKNKEYEKTLQALDESILLDKEYRGLVSEYSIKKKEIYLIQGNKDAYIEQLWKLVLEHQAGDVELYRELKQQYTADEWLVKREYIFKKLPPYAHVEKLYKEEKIYDRLLTCVLNSPGLYALQEYEKVLNKEYPEEILNKYKYELNKMALRASDRKTYSYMVSLLRRMQKIKGGAKVVENIVSDWKSKYRNRPAMMDELRKI